MDDETLVYLDRAIAPYGLAFEMYLKLAEPSEPESRRDDMVNVFPLLCDIALNRAVAYADPIDSASRKSEQNTDVALVCCRRQIEAICFRRKDKMRQDGDPFNRKPRPRPLGSGARQRQSGPRRPEGSSAMPLRRNRLSLTPPKQPDSGKKRRRMLKAAAWRLANIIHANPAALLAMGFSDLEQLVEKNCPRHGHKGSQQGDALRLAAKIARLHL